MVCSGLDVFMGVLLGEPNAQGTQSWNPGQNQPSLGSVLIWILCKKKPYNAERLRALALATTGRGRGSMSRAHVTLFSKMWQLSLCHCCTFEPFLKGRICSLFVACPHNLRIRHKPNRFRISIHEPNSIFTSSPNFRSRLFPDHSARTRETERNEAPPPLLPPKPAHPHPCPPPLPPPKPAPPPPVSRFPPVGRVSIRSSRILQESWVPQPSPCCGCASAAGAFNAPRPRGRALDFFAGF